MTPYTEVLQTLEGAGGASREVDAAVYHALGYKVSMRGSAMVSLWTMTPPGEYGVHEMPRVTASVDACLALVAEKLPGANLTMGIGQKGGWVNIWTDSADRHVIGSSAGLTNPTLPIAILFALFDALFKALSATPEGEG